MNITKSSTHDHSVAWALVHHARCRQPHSCPPARPVKACDGAGSDANAAARRPLDFWAFLERENRRHPGTVPGKAVPTEPGKRAGDDRVISYGMPRLGHVPRSAEVGPALPAPARVVAMTGREVFTPIGTRIDILA